MKTNNKLIEFLYRGDGSLTVSNLIQLCSKAKLGDLDVTVIGVQILGGDHVQYQVSWINNGTRNSQWVEAFELTTQADAGSLRLGFKP